MMPSDLCEYEYDEVIGMMEIMKDRSQDEHEWKKILLKSNGAKIR